VTPAGSVDGDERLRLFLALRLPDEAVSVLSAWQADCLGGGRVVPPEHLHLTLAFLGSRPRGELAVVLGALREAAGAARTPLLEVARYRETRSVGMLELADRDGHAAALAGRVQALLEEAGVYRRERRAWLPHVTVLRFRERPGLRPPLPQLPPFAPSDAAAFLSRLHPAGVRYEVLESFALGG
jgi:RNA 2',3'-cyclic 3'-phosphodiesterase